MMKDTFLIIGGDGFLGSALNNFLLSRNEEVFVSTKRKNRDFDTKHIYLNLLDDIDENWAPPVNVTVVILCAAVASLEKCRLDPIGSNRINVENTIKIAKKCLDKDIFVIFPSTSQVFDGSKPYYDIDDPVSPRTEYGKQKARAEAKLLSLGKNVAIIRFSKIIDKNIPIFDSWIESLKRGENIFPFLDYYMSPILLNHANECLYLIGMNKVPGIIHASGPYDISYSDIAYYIADRLNLPKKLIIPVYSSDSIKSLEHNPKHTTLSTKKTYDIFKIKFPDPLSSIERIF